MKLYGANVCPFVHRVRLALAEKQLEHEYVNIDLYNKPDWYYDVLPTGKVPLLEHDGYRLWESDIVCEYLEEASLETPLWPTKPGEKAQARILLGSATDPLIPLFYKLLRAQESAEQEEAKEKLTEALTKLESSAFQGDSQWLFGDSLSLVDLMVYPWFERWCVLEHYRGFAFPAELTKLAAWKARLQQRPSVQALREPDQFFIDQYVSYAKPATVA